MSENPVPSNATDNFFNSLRGSDWFRAQPRWVGGVCSGLAYRLGWDVRLVRGLAIVLTLLLWFPLVLYGIAWLLMPDGPRGPIQAQQLVHGDFTGQQVGAGAAIILGLATMPASWIWLPGPFAWVVLIGAALIFIVFMASSGTRSSHSPERSQPMTNSVPPTPASEPQRPQPNPAAAGTYPGQPGSVPPPPPGAPGPQGNWNQPKYYYPAPRPQAPALSNTAAFIGLGLVLVISAVGISLLYATSNPMGVVLASIGAVVAVTGAFLAGAALRGKRGGWFLIFSIVGAVLLLPATLAGLGFGAVISDRHVEYQMDVVPFAEEFGHGGPGEWHLSGGGETGPGEQSADDSALVSTHRWLDHTQTRVSAVDSEVVWDLTGTPADQNPALDLEAVNSDITILVTEDQLPSISMLDKFDSEIEVDAHRTQVSERALEKWAKDGFVPAEFPNQEFRQELNLSLTLNDSDLNIIFLPADPAARSGLHIDGFETAQSGA